MVSCSWGGGGGGNPKLPTTVWGNTGIIWLKVVSFSGGGGGRGT